LVVVDGGRPADAAGVLIQAEQLARLGHDEKVVADEDGRGRAATRQGGHPGDVLVFVTDISGINNPHRIYHSRQTRTVYTTHFLYRVCLCIYTVESLIQTKLYEITHKV